VRKGSFIKIGDYQGVIIMQGILRESGSCTVLFHPSIYQASWTGS